MAGARLSVGVPGDFVLARDVCSYGFFILEPNVWRPGDEAFTTTLNVGGRGVSVTMRQGGAGEALRVVADSGLDAAERGEVKRALTRMLRLDESSERIAEFHEADPRWKRGGRGRLMRSPTLFEDVIKTVTSCNVAWAGTIMMNRRLCERFGVASASGARAFPTAEKIARVRAASLRARCSVGYRDARIVELARMFVRGEINPGWLESARTSDEQVYEAMLEWPGIGAYGAANIMQLLGRYDRLPLDTESVRHGREVLGYRGTGAQIMKRVKAHYEAFGVHKFRSYWFEVWDCYERRRGASWTWVRETTGKTLTASRLRAEDFAGETPEMVRSGDAMKATHGGAKRSANRSEKRSEKRGESVAKVKR